jgi:hypothetical protein
VKLIHSNSETYSRIIDEDDTILFEKYCEDGQYIKFNVDYIDEIHYEWFCKVLGKQIDQALNHREMMTRKKIQNNFKNLLGL